MEESRSEERARRAFQMTYGAPFFEGNAIAVLRNGDEIFPAMLEAIRSAEQSIKFLTFVYWTGDIAVAVADALADRARAGVEVKVLLDAFGAHSMSRDLIRIMRAAGAEVRWYRPISSWRLWALDNRTHRKVLVTDDRIGFTGGVGIAAEWEGNARNAEEWRDTHFRLTGPVVDGLISSFLDNWTEGGQPISEELQQTRLLSETGDASILVVRSTAAIGWSAIANLLQTLVALAESRLRIATPYFTPDARTAALLIAAAKKGVDVEILIPGPHIDKRVSELAASDHFRPMMEAGIKIWQYQTSMMHCKAIILDGRFACIGSANFNRRSMRKDDEVALIVNHPQTLATLERHFVEDLAESSLLDLAQWGRRGLGRRALERISSIMRPHV